MERCQSGPFLATCAGGLEKVLVQELTSRSVPVQISSTYAGGVAFKTAAGPEDIKLLRSADNIYAFVLHKQPIPLEKEPGLEYLQSVANEIDWGRALSTFRQWNPELRHVVWPPGKASNGDAESLPSFRVTCERRSQKFRKHGFTSMDAAGWLGAGIGDLLGWPASMNHFDLEIIATISDDELLLALSLLYSPRARPNKAGPKSGPDSDGGRTAREQDGTEGGEGPLQAKARQQSRQLYSRRPYRKDLVRTSLKPSTAYALCQLADIRPGHVVLDPLCGCGTIPLEVADYYGPAVAAFGGEIINEAVDKAGRNLGAGQQGGKPGPCDVIRWDATRLPWRDRTVDRVVSDMPFGVLCGRAVLLCQGRKIRGDLEQPQVKDLFQLEESFPLNMEGILVDVHILRRTEMEVVVKPKATTGRARDRSRKRRKAPDQTVQDPHTDVEHLVGAA